MWDLGSKKRNKEATQEETSVNGLAAGEKEGGTCWGCGAKSGALTLGVMYPGNPILPKWMEFCASSILQLNPPY